MTDVINHLERLQTHSRQYLDPKVIYLIQSHDRPRVLVRGEVVANTKTAIKPVDGPQSLSKSRNRQSIRKTRTFATIGEDPAMRRLNLALTNGNDYPVLTAVIGTVGGIVSSGAGFIFTAATTGVSRMHTNHKVIVRPGDEIWHVEEIGRDPLDLQKAVYVSAYFVVDPYRSQTPRKGWLIHEERHDLVLS